MGYHDGAILYTIGQRHGLGLTDGLPYYVVKKDIPRNIVYVSRNLNQHELWHQKIQLKDVILRQGPVDLVQPLSVQARIRHRAPLVPAKFHPETQTLDFANAQKALTPGQSIVFYQDQVCLGGGIITS